jgi:NAD(P)-dependent dehydrogenase (short-subunit alcohol dehydrogenase family)
MSEHKKPVTVIIGATGGIGRAVVDSLSADGHRLVLGARTKDEVHDLSESYDALPFVVDATQFDQVKAIVDHAVDTFGSLTGIVNLAGSIMLKPAHLTSTEDFVGVFEKNLLTAFHVVKAAARSMMSDGGGSIVLMSSAPARVGLPNHEAIAAAKAGIEGLVRSAASSYSNRNVRINAVAPGLVRTPLSASILSTSEGENRSKAMHPLGMIGEPADVAGAISWLLDPEASRWVTGQVIGVDGGLATVRPRM